MSIPFRTAALPLPHDLVGAAQAQRAVAAVKHRLGAAFEAPACAIILGSGLGALADAIEDAHRIAFTDIPGFPTATIAGHAGQLIVGRLAGRPVVALAGRLHLYEGHEASVAAFPVRVLHALGARALLISNAAGGVNRSFAPGDLMVVADHINLTFRNPLFGAVESGDTRFPDMSSPYDEPLRALIHRVARANGIALHDGVYAAVLGPSYETPAEVRMLATFGADAVGMSTVPEVIVATAMGLPVAAISLITNHAAGVTATPLAHDDVLAVGREASARFVTLVRGVIEALPA